MKLIALIVVLFISGCATLPLNGGDKKVTKVDYPEIGLVVTAYVGDQLLQKGMITEEKVLRV